jgi:TonB family protein
VTQAAVSASFSRFEHMSPEGAALALLLHAVVALALWWAAPIHSNDEPEETIEVTMEAPPSPPPPQPEASQPPIPSPPPAARNAPPVAPPARPQAPSVPLGLPPPTPNTPDKAQQLPSPPPPTQTDPQQATAPPQPVAPPPSLEQALPPVEAPPPPVRANELPEPVLPPPASEARPKPVPQAPPTPAPPHAALAPSPLSRLQQGPPPQSSSRTNEPQTTFVNPAATYTRSRAKDEYLWAVIHKFSQRLPDLRQKNEGGTLVIRFAIARDGRLVDVGIVSSSGVKALDDGMVEAIRSSSPYAPFPPGISDSELVFVQPFVARR